MKAVFIVYNQAHNEKVDFILDRLGITGYSEWNNMKGRGGRGGLPHLGTHTWPEINSATLTIIDDDQVDKLLDAVKKMDELNTDVGARAFVWDVTNVY
jgi:nitrogen regulatory protein PII